MFDQMLQEGMLPNKFTFVTMLDACVSLTKLARGKQMHAHMVATGVDSNVITGNALVHMYGRFGSLDDARRIFDQMIERNVISWTAIIAAYAQPGQFQEAFLLIEHLQNEGVMLDKVTYVGIFDICGSLSALMKGKQMHARIVGTVCESDEVVGTALISMYGKCGSLEEAWRMFDNMPKRSVVSWNAMIAAYAKSGLYKEALKLFEQLLLEGLVPTEVTFISFLDACACLTAWAEGKNMHARIVGRGFESTDVGNALIAMYGKCGSLQNAQRVFDTMPERNRISWTAIIVTYGQHGWGKAALQLFHEMQTTGVMPDTVTFVGILSACSHAGLVDEAYDCLISMKHNYGIAPTMDHYICMVGLLGRVGQLDQAEDLIYLIPIHLAAVSLRTLLGACRYHFDVERGERTAKHAFELDLGNASLYVTLSNIYATDDLGDTSTVIHKINNNSLMQLRLDLIHCGKCYG